MRHFHAHIYKYNFRKGVFYKNNAPLLHLII